MLDEQTIKRLDRLEDLVANLYDHHPEVPPPPEKQVVSLLKQQLAAKEREVADLKLKLGG